MQADDDSRSLDLVVADFSALDTIWRNPLPFALWPVGNQPLLDHWLDHAVRNGVDRLRLHAVDRPAELRSHLCGAGYWSLDVEVHALRDQREAPHGARRLVGLPTSRQAAQLPESPVQLLKFWLDLQSEWLESRAADTLAIDRRVAPDGWLGPHVEIDPQARLVPPYWIGERVAIGRGAVVGPRAFIGSRSLLDGNVQVANAVVLAGTFAGRNTRIDNAAAGPGMLVDIKRGCRVDIGESFILSSVDGNRRGSRLPTRLAALLLFLLLAPLAWPLQLRGRSRLSAIRGRYGDLELSVGHHGPLLLRRWSWLWQLARGRMRLLGVLPRSRDDLAGVPPESAQRLCEFPLGLVSWADLNRCHDASDPDEWVHALYQVMNDGAATARAMRRRAARVLLAPPAPGKP